MKKLLIVAVLAAAAFFYLHKQPVKTEASAAPPEAPRQTYEHDWAKHSLDRTHEVMRDVRERKKSDENP
jgi:hypothetical protein